MENTANRGSLPPGINDDITPDNEVNAVTL